MKNRLTIAVTVSEDKMFSDLTEKDSDMTTTNQRKNKDESNDQIIHAKQIFYAVPHRPYRNFSKKLLFTSGL